MIISDGYSSKYRAMMDEQPEIIRCEEISKWLMNLKDDIGKTQYQPLWHYAEALDMAIKALSSSEIPNSSDTISRQAAIDAIVNRETTTTRGTEYLDGYAKCQHDILDIINQLPSAQPEIIRCKDCKWWGLSDYNTFGIHICKRFGGVRGESDFCSRAERREDE